MVEGRSFTGASTGWFILGSLRAAAYIIHSIPAHRCSYMLMKPSLPQAKRAEVLSISAEFEDGPGSDSGRRLEHRHGLRGEAEGGVALVCVREAVLHQRTGARRTPELLTPCASLWTTDGRRTRATVCVVPVSHECHYKWFKVHFQDWKLWKDLHYSGSIHLFHLKGAELPFWKEIVS